MTPISIHTRLLIRIILFLNSNAAQREYPLPVDVHHGAFHDTVDDISHSSIVKGLPGAPDAVQADLGQLFGELLHGFHRVLLLLIL